MGKGYLLYYHLRPLSTEMKINGQTIDSSACLPWSVGHRWYAIREIFLDRTCMINTLGDFG